MSNHNFWKGKKVFLTGHTGFKGSWLTLWLTSMGAKVKGFSLEPPTVPSLFVEADIANLCDVHQIGDIRDVTKLRESLVDYQPEIVIHMAAQPLVRYSYEHPIETYQTNVMGTVHLLDAVRYCDSVRSVVNITTDKCYENQEWVWGYRENEPMGGYDPYSNSKGCSELVISAYRNSFFNPNDYIKHGVAVASVRAGNVIGGGDWAEDRLVPDILKSFEKNKCVEIRNPHSIRPWQHVLEPLSGYLNLAERLFNDGAKFNGGWNFGPESNDAKSVEYIVNKMANLWGADANWHVNNGNHPHEANYLKLDCSKAALYLDWHPRLSLDTALASIISWHKAWLDSENMQEFCLKEITKYSRSKEYK